MISLNQTEMSLLTLPLMISLNQTEMSATYTAIDDIVESDRDVTTYTAIDDIIDGHQLVLVLDFLLTFGIGTELGHTLCKFFRCAVCEEMMITYN